MHNELTLKLKEALMAVLPIAALVLIVNFTIVGMPVYNILVFLISVVLLVIGIALFGIGADVSMMAMGEKLGSYIIKTRKLWFITIVTLIIGILATVAEPDLKVLAEQTPFSNRVIIYSVAIGVGVFLVVAFYRILLQIKLSYLLMVLYALAFIMAAMVSEDFVPLAFDSGGVTTGPITVPFIMALGAGLASVRGDKTAEQDSFGLVALCSIGPILTVLILGLVSGGGESRYNAIVFEEYTEIGQAADAFFKAFPVYMEEVLHAVLPLLIFFLVFQFLFLKLNKKALVKILAGLLYTYVGLVLFLTGANVGFMSIGYYIGYYIADSGIGWLLVPLGMLMGFFIVMAEPAVQVLRQQVEDMTEGAVNGRVMGCSLSIGVAVAVGFAMLRVITGISIWYMILPGYLLALIITFFVPPIYTAIAFDSGGVASGPMTATFLLPLAMGACEGAGGSIMTDAFGIVTMVAMTPVITVQVLGLIAGFKSKSLVTLEIIADSDIIDFDIE